MNTMDWKKKKRAETLFGMNCTKFNVHALSLHVEWESRYIPRCLKKKMNSGSIKILRDFPRLVMLIFV